jgi:pyruvate, orthophosphate dikinase
LITGSIIKRGAASGRVAFSIPEKVCESVILITENISENILSRCKEISGLLLLREEKSSHGAIFVGSNGIPTISQIASSCKLYEESIEINGVLVTSNDYLSLDACSGKVYRGKRNIIHPKDFPELLTLRKWFKECAKMKVFSGVDLPDGAKKAIERGADGIDARTEHMFFEKNKLFIFRQVLLSENVQNRESFLKKLLEYQIRDFIDLFTACNNKTLILRLLDPPRAF